jgi:hypothetical protein
VNLISEFNAEDSRFERSTQFSFQLCTIRADNFNSAVDRRTLLESQITVEFKAISASSLPFPFFDGMRNMRKGKKKRKRKKMRDPLANDTLLAVNHFYLIDYFQMFPHKS